jgi:uncharacterized protein DUF6496
MPEKRTVQRARKDARQGKAPSTQAGEFVREEIHHVREGKHGARSPQQAIAIGLSKARRSGVKLSPPKKGTTSARTRQQAKRDLQKGKRGMKSTSKRRASATRTALKRESRRTTSRSAMSLQAKRAWHRRRTRGTATSTSRTSSRTRTPRK